jgi:suppressor of ftsI
MTMSPQMIKLQHTLAVACLLTLGACGGDQDTGEVRLVHSAGQAGRQSVSHPLQSPREIVSQNGELRATFTASDATVEVAGKSFHTIAYDNEFTPPLLRVKPGDTIFLNLNNQTGEPTNEHFRGLNVSPRINPDATVSDDVFIQADPGTQVNYKISIPPGHNPGLYWYHAHVHGQAERQVMGGLSGGLIVEGVLDPFPELAAIREQVLLLKDVQITAQGTLPQDIDPGADTNRTINGQTMPSLAIAPEELQFWRFANIGADMYYRLVLDGHVFYELARDGNRHNQLVEMREILLPPGARSEVFVRGAARGQFKLRTLDVNTGPDGDNYAAAELATVVVTAGPPRPRLELPRMLPAVEDLRTLPVARRRTITFSEDTTNNTFFIDSGAGPAQFDPNRVDATITSGTIEEWTVNNATAELHDFNIHQTDFQVLEVNGDPQPFVGHQDHVDVPYQPQGGAPGTVKILIDFRNPDIVGKFVYHCHILEHEDGGMMSVAEVVHPAGAQ